MRLRDHIEKLNYYVLAIEKGSISQGARAAKIGQPQMTKVIKQLEEILGTQLIVRSQKGIEMTAEGQRVYDFSKDFLNQTDKFEFTLKSQQTSLKGQISVGTYDSISRYFFPDFIKYLKTLSSDLELSLYTTRSAQIIKKLKKMEIDLAVYVGAITDKNIISKVVYEDHFSFYRSKSLAPQFKDHLILFPQSIEQDTTSILKSFPHHHICENLETVVSLINSGLGVGLIPTKVAYQSVAKGMMVQDEEFSSFKLGLHTISVAINKKNMNETSQTVYDEIFRFLNIWSQ